MAQLPFMDVALWRMPLVARLQESAFETDGRLLWFDAARVIDLYRKNPNEVLRGYFHTIMHCVFRHPFDDKHPERALWDIACDASVEATAIELLGTGFPKRARRRGKTYAWQNPRELPDPHRAEHLSRAYRNRRGRPARVLLLFCRFARKRVRTRRARGVATNQRARVLDEKRRRQARPDAFRRNRQAQRKARRRCGQRG